MELLIGHSYLVTDTFAGSGPSTKVSRVEKIRVVAIRDHYYQIYWVARNVTNWLLKEDFYQQYNIEDKLGKGKFTSTITTD